MLVGCGSGSTSDADPGAAAGEPVEASPVNVTATRLEPGSLRERIGLAGRLKPWTEVEVASELGGTVQEVRFDKGDWVGKGQELARVGTDLLEAALAEAEAELAGAKADYEKTSELFDRQAVPRQDLVAATSVFERAEARAAHARLRVGRSILRAPIAGVALDREIESGEVIPPGAHVTTLHEVSRLKAEVGIPESDISFFERGGEATIEVGAYAGEVFSGRIHFLATAARGPNRSFPAEVAIENADRRLKPGMLARVSLVKRVFEEAVVVPRDAVLERDEGNVAFVVEDGRAVLRRLETGASAGPRIVVLQGLAPGEELIVTGQRNLIDGQRVRVVSRTEAAPEPASAGSSAQGDSES